MTITALGSIHGPRVRTTRQRIDFWHGIDEEVLFDARWELVQQRQSWVRSQYGVDAFEDKPLVDGFTSFDLSDGGYSLQQYATLLNPRDFAKLEFVMRQQTAQHDDAHFVRLRPYCPSCRGSAMFAKLSLASWLMRNPGRLPKEESDAELPWDTEQVLEPEIVDQGSLYMDRSQLARMRPPHDLIEGVIPTKGVGYITGRDRSLKTFLALDVVLHVAAMMPFWHEAGKDGADRARRKVGFNGEGKVIFAAGEGVSSFNPRIEAWIKAQHVKGWPMSDIRTADDTMAVRDQYCETCKNAVDDLLGHVHHVSYTDDGDFVLEPGFGELEDRNLIVKRGTVNLFAGGDDFRYLLALARREKPDVVVLDTLALSSGGADQQSNSEMGEVHARAKQIADASEGVVIIVAHTDKGDNDARGASVIEDNADFVLHCTRVDNEQLEIKVAKRKDAEDNWKFMLAVEEVDLGFEQSSLILKDWDREQFAPPDPDEDLKKPLIDAAERIVAEKGHNVFDAVEFAHGAELQDISTKTVRRILDKLVEDGDLQRIDGFRGKGGRTRYHFGVVWLETRRAQGWTIANHDEDPNAGGTKVEP